MTSFARKHTADQYRSIRKILRGNPPEPIDNPPASPLIALYDVNEEMIHRLLRVLYYRAIIACILFMLRGFESPSWGYTEEQAIKAVIGEAEGEPQQGKEAVACALHYRGYLEGVYGLSSPRVKYHRYSRKTYLNAKLAVRMAEDQEYCEGLVNGAQYWEGTNFPVPSWAKSMTLTAVIGNQRFYRKDI